MTWIRIAWQAGTIIAVAGIALANVIGLGRRVPPRSVPVPGVVVDVVIEQEARLARVGAALQRRGVKAPIAYFSDIPREVDGSKVTEDHYLAQYVLVPAVVDPGAVATPWAVANLRHGAALPAGWLVEEDFGRGVYLLRR